MKKKELKDLSLEDKQKKLKDLQEELILVSSGAAKRIIMKSPGKIKTLKRDIARLLTYIHKEKSVKK